MKGYEVCGESREHLNTVRKDIPKGGMAMARLGVVGFVTDCNTGEMGRLFGGLAENFRRVQLVNFEEQPKNYIVTSKKCSLVALIRNQSTERPLLIDRDQNRKIWDSLVSPYLPSWIRNDTLYALLIPKEINGSFDSIFHEVHEVLQGLEGIAQKQRSFQE